MNKGNRHALRKGYFDPREADFICGEARTILKLRNASAWVDHRMWWVHGTINGDERTYSVHPSTSPATISFEEC